MGTSSIFCIQRSPHLVSNVFPGLGWLRDLPDPRDYTVEHGVVAAILDRLPAADTSPPRRVDLREEDEGVYFSPPEDQGRLHSSSAFACLAMVEYFQRRVQGQTFDGSPLFLYEMARRVAGFTGNCGVGVRVTLKALRRYGAPPLELRPYAPELCDQAMGDQVLGDLSYLGFSKDLEGLMYFRLDVAEQSGDETLARLKAFLAAGFPTTIGFAVPRSLKPDGIVTFRSNLLDAYRGGQTVLAVGYDDKRLPGQGAVLLRNSWGPEWGEGGYGWLSYDFVRRGLAADMWTMIGCGWPDLGEFQRPHFSHAAR